VTLNAVNTFAGYPLDRASERRGDEAFLAAAAASPQALAVAFWEKKPLVEQAASGGLQIAYLPAPMSIELAPSEEDRLFLGLWRETPVFAVEIAGEADPAMGPLSGMGRFEELRAVALELPGPDAAILAAAKAAFEWRARHRFCAACGEPSRIADGGWKRVCPACRLEHFPRTDPVVIMLPVFEGRCMVGRQAAWPAKMFSALAGFLEPGETIEEACARELKEEAGLNTLSVRYHSSQPWPYPSSLMIGLLAEVDSDEATPDQTELAAVCWLTREEARAVLAGENPEIRSPTPLAIAHHLLQAFANGG